MSRVTEFLIKIGKAIPFAVDLIISPLYRASLRHCGRHVRLRPLSSDFKGLENLSIGDGTTLPKHTVIYCTKAPVTIGRQVVFGPRPTIISGDHRFDIPGRYIAHCLDKMPENDLPIIIGDDVWVGANVTILKGVTIGKGSIIAAGSVVTKDIPPCTIAGGIPAKVLKPRFNNESESEIHLHYLEEHQERTSSS